MVPCTALQINGMAAGRETIIGIVKTEQNKTEYAILSKRVKPQDPKLTAREKRIHAVFNSWKPLKGFHHHCRDATRMTIKRI